MTDAATEKAIKTEYKELKSAINAAPGDFNTLKRLTDIFTPLVHFAGIAADKIVQIPAIVSVAGTAAGPYVPAVSAALGAVTLVTTGVTLWKGLGFKSRNDETVRGYKTQFNRAARGFLGAQIVSTASMAASALTYGAGEHFGLAAVGNGSPVQMIIGTALGVVGAIAGWKAHANAAKLSVYSTAIRNAKNTAVPAPAAPAEPSVPTVA